MGYSESAFSYGTAHFCGGAGSSHNAINRTMPIGEDTQLFDPSLRDCIWDYSLLLCFLSWLMWGGSCQQGQRFLSLAVYS